MSKKPLFCCAKPSIPASHPHPLISLFFSALRALKTQDPRFPKFSASTTLLPNQLIEFEMVSRVQAYQRAFTCHYFAPVTEGKYASRAYAEMYPEGSLMEVSLCDLETRWGEEREWWRKHESLRDNERASWKCASCGVGYCARALQF